MDDTFIQKVTADLPNFPPDVIRQWFDHGLNEGWPPTLDQFGVPEGTWRKVLGDRELGFWRTVRWDLEQSRLQDRDLEPMTFFTIELMRVAYGQGLPCHPSLPIKDSSARIGAFVRMIEATGRLPVPPLFLERTEGLEILDGCHRLAALSHVHASGRRADEAHDVWIARSSSPA